MQKTGARGNVQLNLKDGRMRGGRRKEKVEG